MNYEVGLRTYFIKKKNWIYKSKKKKKLRFYKLFQKYVFVTTIYFWMDRWLIETFWMLFSMRITSKKFQTVVKK